MELILLETSPQAFLVLPEQGADQLKLEAGLALLSPAVLQQQQSVHVHTQVNSSVTRGRAHSRLALQHQLPISPEPPGNGTVLPAQQQLALLPVLLGPYFVTQRGRAPP